MQKKYSNNDALEESTIVDELWKNCGLMNN